MCKDTDLKTLILFNLEEFVMEWQPINTAPTEGVAILGFQRLTSELWVIVPMCFDGGVWRLLAFHNDNTEHEMVPTHWVPIPEPPEE